MATVAVTINSRKYDVVADESVEYIEMLGEHVNEKVDLVLRGGRNIMGERPVVLAALNICDEYFKVQEAGRLMKEQLQTSTDKLTAAQSENKKLKNENKKLKAELEEAESNQITIDETAIKAETANAKKQLEEAETQIKFLEGQIELLEDKLKKMEKDYAAREQEILEMIDKEVK